jgi:hypothetical protein
VKNQLCRSKIGETVVSKIEVQRAVTQLKW